MRSEPTRDGWAVKRPDGSFVAGSHSIVPGQWNLGALAGEESAVLIAQMTSGDRKSSDYLNVGAAATALGYTLVPVRLVEIEPEQLETEEEK